MPLTASGAKARHTVGFVRDRLLGVVPRLVVGLGGDWAETAIDIPDGSWGSLLTGEEQEGGPRVPVAELTRRFPVAVLARRAASR
jgi:(1->4)-alpha-D-glucan 1-alpha-D-glucosylmutase